MNTMNQQWNQDEQERQQEVLSEQARQLNQEVVSFFASHSVGQHLLKKIASLRGNASEALAAGAGQLPKEEIFQLRVEFEAANCLLRVIAEAHSGVYQAELNEQLQEGEL